MRHWLREYSLSVTLGGLFIGSWLLQTLGGWQSFASDQAAQGSVPHVLGPDGYIWTWVEATFENWQSEFLQLFTFVVLTVFLIHRGSHESRDGEDRMQRQLDEVLRRLEAIQPQRAGDHVVEPGSGTARAAVSEAESAEASPPWVATPIGGALYFVIVIVLGAAISGLALLILGAQFG